MNEIELPLSIQQDPNHVLPNHMLVVSMGKIEHEEDKQPVPSIAVGHLGTLFQRSLYTSSNVWRQIVIEVYKDPMHVLSMYTCKENGVSHKPEDYKLIALSVRHPLHDALQEQGMFG